MAFQGDSIYWVEVEKIVPNPFQPRREFDEQKLKELSDSVRMYGILQPLTVTRKEIQRDDGTFYTEYELIAGERRLRASKLAGLAQVPVIIREGEDSEQEKLELAIIENLQREDLNAVDRALAFRQLADVFGLSHVQVARKVGRSREYVSNSIRLLGLPDYMLSALKQAEISEGHARTLLMLNDKPEEQDVVFREILLKKISVRETESIVRKIAMEKVRKKTLPDFDTQLIEIEKRFMETLGTRVQIQKTEYGGRLTIDYFNVDDLEEMLKRMRSGEPLSNISYTGPSLTEAVPLSHLNLTEGDAPLSALALAEQAATQASSAGMPSVIESEVSEPLSDGDLTPAITSYPDPSVSPTSSFVQATQDKVSETVVETSLAPDRVADGSFLVNQDWTRPALSDLTVRSIDDSVFQSDPRLEEAVLPAIPPVTALEERPELTPQTYVPPPVPMMTPSPIEPVSNYTSPDNRAWPQASQAVTGVPSFDQHQSKPENKDPLSPAVPQRALTTPASLPTADINNQPPISDQPQDMSKEDQTLTKNDNNQDSDDSNLYSIRNFTI